jgi:uncharacterized protein
MIALLRAFLSLLVFTTSTCAVAASFDCTNAKSKTEKLICSDRELSSLDDVLNGAYKRAYERAASKSVLRQSQRDWLASYELGACNDAACLKTHVSERIAILNEVAAGGEPSAQWSGTYVRYWKGKMDRDAASISILGLRTGRLYVSGKALWYGPQANTGQVNDGQMEGYTDRIMAADTAKFDTDGCSASLLLHGNLLEVKDETGCGGLNVTFNGKYQRK